MFSSPLKLAPTSAKRGKTSLDWQECFICQTKSPEKLYIFTDKGKLCFVQATEVRKDEVYRRIVEELSSVNHIISENIEVKYHRSCCKSYTSKQNLTRYSHETVSKQENTDSACMNSPAASSVITTRSDWQSCIFCTNKTYKKDGKLHKVESEERMKNILEAARHNLDPEIEFKVLHEHFYDNALYHSASMTNYLLKTPKEKVNLETSDHKTAFLRFVSEINSDLMVERKAFLMSTLLERFRTFLPKERADKYTMYKLQNRLLNHYSDSIVIQPQQGQGKSNIMFSSSISIGDAIKAASKLKSYLKIAQIDLEISDTKDTLSEEQILHSAANILRWDIHSLDMNNDFYPTSSECSLPISIQSMPPALTKFISWLIDEKSFLAVSNQNQTPIEKMRKCMSLMESSIIE